MTNFINPSRQQYTAKGDLIFASNGGMPNTLTVGINGEIIAADTSESLKVKWSSCPQIYSAILVAKKNPEDNQMNATGDGTLVTLSMSQEYFDIGNDYDGINTFTAPENGYYFSVLHATFHDVNGTGSAYLQIVTSNRTYRSTELYAGRTRSASNILRAQMFVIADMDAGDVLQGKIVDYNQAGKTVDTYRDGGMITGYLNVFKIK